MVSVVLSSSETMAIFCGVTNPPDRRGAS